MNTALVSIGITLIKMGVLGGVGAGIITGIKWFGKFEPSLNTKKTRGGSESDNVGESLRKRLADRS